MSGAGVELRIGKIELSKSFAEPKSAIAASTRYSPCFISMFAYTYVLSIIHSIMNQDITPFMSL